MSETKTNFKNELKSATSLILTFSLPILQHYHIHQNAPGARCYDRLWKKSECKIAFLHLAAKNPRAKWLSCRLCLAVSSWNSSQEEIGLPVDICITQIALPPHMIRMMILKNFKKVATSWSSSFCLVLMSYLCSVLVLTTLWKYAWCVINLTWYF